MSRHTNRLKTYSIWLGMVCLSIFTGLWLIAPKLSYSLLNQNVQDAQESPLAISKKEADKFEVSLSFMDDFYPDTIMKLKYSYKVKKTFPFVGVSPLIELQMVRGTKLPAPEANLTTVYVLKGVLRVPLKGQYKLRVVDTTGKLIDEKSFSVD